MCQVKHIVSQGILPFNDALSMLPFDLWNLPLPGIMSRPLCYRCRMSHHPTSCVRHHCAGYGIQCGHEQQAHQYDGGSADCLQLCGGQGRRAQALRLPTSPHPLLSGQLIFEIRCSRSSHLGGSLGRYCQCQCIARALLAHAVSTYVLSQFVVAGIHLQRERERERNATCTWTHGLI
jgi:hypothetical protein